MSAEVRPELRDCPFCKANGSDDEKVLFIGHEHFYNGGSYTASYEVRCWGCGASIEDEYRSEVIRLWNGEDKPEDEA